VVRVAPACGGDGGAYKEARLKPIGCNQLTRIRDSQTIGVADRIIVGGHCVVSLCRYRAWAVARGPAGERFERASPPKVASSPAWPCPPARGALPGPAAAADQLRRNPVP